LFTVCHSNTWWAVVPKKAAAVAETSRIKEKRLYYRLNYMTHQVTILTYEFIQRLFNVHREFVVL